MLIATWNLNNRVGMTPFRPEAANAAIALGADLMVLTEFYPQQHEATFRNTLKNAGWPHQEMSKDTGARANRILIASRCPIQTLSIPPPDFDQQFPANVLCIEVPSVGISIVGVRVPWYNKKSAGLVIPAWDWLEETAAFLADRSAVIMGDLNVSLKSPRSRGGEHFRRILQSGWHRATPAHSASFFRADGASSEIDHILGTDLCQAGGTRYVTELGGYQFAGGLDPISDHAALVTEVAAQNAQP